MPNISARDQQRYDSRGKCESCPIGKVQDRKNLRSTPLLHGEGLGMVCPGTDRSRCAAFRYGTINGKQIRGPRAWDSDVRIAGWKSGTEVFEIEASPRSIAT